MKLKKNIVMLFAFFVGQCCAADLATLKVDHTKEIVFGQSGSFSGHFKYYGVAIRDAINACFASVNAAGGIKGKKLRLISLDDHGDAELTKKNIELLYNHYGITMFLGVMGTRGVLAVFDMIKEKKIGMYFFWGSDKKLSDPKLTNMINGFGLPDLQVEKLAHYVTQDLALQNISIFHADDSFSTELAWHLDEVLTKENIKPRNVVSYNRFTMNIEKRADDIIKVDPRVVICIGTSLPIARLIGHFMQQGFFGTKFVGTDATFLVSEILVGKRAEFSFVSSVPDPKKSDLPIALEYRANLAQWLPDADISTFSFSYYIAASILCTALQEIKGDITNESLIKRIESFEKKSIKGFTVDFNPANRFVWNKNFWIIG